MLGATLYTAGTWDVTATDTVSGITGSISPNVIAAPATSLYVIAPSSAVSGSAFDVTVAALDPYGNIDTNYGGTVTWATTDPDPNVVLPPDYPMQPSDAGVVTFPSGATLITLGDQLITASDTVSGITGSADVTVTAMTLRSLGVGLAGAVPAALSQATAIVAPSTTPSPMSRASLVDAAIVDTGAVGYSITQNTPLTGDVADPFNLEGTRNPFAEATADTSWLLTP